MKEYKLVGDHAEDLADGRMFGPGETVKLSQSDLDDPHNKRLIEEGVLLELSDKNMYEDGVKPKGKPREEE